MHLIIIDTVMLSRDMREPGLFSIAANIFITSLLLQIVN